MAYAKLQSCTSYICPLLNLTTTVNFFIDVALLHLGYSRQNMLLTIFLIL